MQSTVIKSKRVYRQTYPCPMYIERTEWYGKAWDASARTDGRSKIHLGRHDTREAAEAAYAHWLATGERPPRRKYTAQHSERTARVMERKAMSGTRYDTKGTSRQTGRRKDIHIGSYWTREEAQQAAEAYLKDGTLPPKRGVLARARKEFPARAWINTRTNQKYGTHFVVYGTHYVDGLRKHAYLGVFQSKEEAEAECERFKREETKGAPRPRKNAKDLTKPKVRKASGPRGPRVKVEDIRIIPGRNLRDHEVDALARHRPELVSVSGRPKPMEAVRDQSRIRRPGEPFADWVRRITDTSVAA